MNQINNRLELLRSEMKKNGVSATIIPGTDPHASEYLAKHWQERNWISGFTGSAGTAVITLDKAAVWTDSRYFIQAENQLNDSEFFLMKDRLPETPDIITWLLEELSENAVIGLNPEMFAHQVFIGYQTRLNHKKINIKSIDFIDLIWKNRSSLPQNPLKIFDVKYAGISVKEKLENIRKAILRLDTTVYVLSNLDEIAWVYNIRGNDVNFNPLVISYAVIEKDHAHFFVDKEKLTEETIAYFDLNEIIIHDYNEIYKFLNELNSESKILFDGQKLNQNLFESIPKTCQTIYANSPITDQKSLKNRVEAEGFRKAMIKDGVALTRFFIWLENNIHQSITEYNVGEELIKFRSEQELFQGASFNTICGYAGNGAMNHYSAKKDSAAVLGTKDLILIDSGGQYLDGTTDITRTLKLGEATAQEKKDYTLVLKGMIALSQAKFPINTRGSQLDVLARQFMWEEAINFGHGTGHGVGHFLCVHEGPQSIRMEENSVTLKPGMVLSNEPGIYRTNEYGIRIENLLLVTEAEKTEFGDFLHFETLTLCPIDQTLIDFDLLSLKDKKWLNNYHRTVYEKLSPSLDENEKLWLEEKCKPID